MAPAAVRRPVTVTAMLVASIAILLLSPLLLAVAALVSALTGRPALIFARLGIDYFALELACLFACAWLWMASLCGLLMRTRLFQHLHYALLRWFVHVFTRRWLALLDIDVEEEPSTAATAALEGDEPLLFFSRHAGPGDTIVLIDRLLTRFDRLPRIVFKETVALDPCIDLIGHRLPHGILDTADKEQSEARIEQLASELDARGVLLLFPEGGNFTAERRRRALGKLRRTGRRREADKGADMHHVLPPRPSGALSALRGNPGADVIFGAHTGLGLAAFPTEIYRDPPLHRTFRSHVWLAPAAERPAEPDAQVVWLYDWWKRLDDWVEQGGEER
jgi:1-acyl-sn-glycerol-3-phosphate acyltransferase